MPTIADVSGVELNYQSRGRRLVNLVTITRTDGTQLTFTDSDRAITVFGVTFHPVSLGSADDMKLVAGLRPSTQQISGLVDGTNIKINDICGGRYRGAKLVQSIVDARAPHIFISNQMKTLTQIKYSTKGWTAQCLGVTQRMEAPRDARFNGVYSPICPYRLGGAFCKKDIEYLKNPGIQVSTVLSNYSKFQTTNGRWRAAYTDAQFREGEFQWIWSTPLVTGTSTSINTSTSLTDTTKSWTVDEHVGRWVRLLQSAGGPLFLGGGEVEFALITGNTSNTLSFGGGRLTAHAAGVNYDICGTCDNFGTISPIAYYTDSSRQIELFFPTPLPIQAGDSGIVRPGCDGRFSTCQGIYANQLNFGGIDVDAPTAGEVIKTPEDS